MSDTPKTDAARISAWGEGGIESSIGFTTVPVDFARTLERENATLRQQLAEKESADSGVTHWTGCSESGARHYKCALAELNALRETVMDLRNKLEKKPWVGLTDEDREECLAKNEELGWWGVVNAIEQSLKEKNGG